MASSTGTWNWNFTYDNKDKIIPNWDNLAQCCQRELPLPHQYFVTTEVWTCVIQAKGQALITEAIGTTHYIIINAWTIIKQTFYSVIKSIQSVDSHYHQDGKCLYIYINEKCMDLVFKCVHILLMNYIMLLIVQHYNQCAHLQLTLRTAWM